MDVRNYVRAASASAPIAIAGSVVPGKIPARNMWYPPAAKSRVS